MPSLSDHRRKCQRCVDHSSRWYYTLFDYAWLASCNIAGFSPACPDNAGNLKFMAALPLPVHLEILIHVEPYRKSQLRLSTYQARLARVICL